MKFDFNFFVRFGVAKASQSLAMMFIAAFFAGCDSNDSKNYSGGSSSSVSSSVGSSSSVAGGFEAADGIVGGQLFSKFWADETGFSVENSNLTAEEQLEYIDDNADFFRCKHCHGWDRLGREGGYSNRAPSTTRPNVSPVNLALRSEMLSAEDLFDAIKMGSARRDLSVDLSTYDPQTNSIEGDRMPDFGAILTDQQIWDIVKYLKEEALDTTELYTLTLGDGEYPERSRSFSNIGLDGDATNGDQIFATTCATCHGADGTSILVDGGEYTVGGHIRSKPYEDQHKVKFGHLGSIMTAEAVLSDATAEDIKDLFAALSDATQYPDEQPVAEDGQALFNANCASCHTKASRAGATATSIRNAINNNTGGMSVWSSLTDPQLEAIAAYIAQ